MSKAQISEMARFRLKNARTCANEMLEQLRAINFADAHGGIYVTEQTLSLVERVREHIERLWSDANDNEQGSRNE